MAMKIAFFSLLAASGLSLGGTVMMSPVDPAPATPSGSFVSNYFVGASIGF